MNKSLVFTPGCKWKIDRHILFVEYETVTGEPESKRFDLSAGTEYIANGYKILSFDEISKPESKLQYSIQKIVYFEKECNSMMAFSRGCRQTRLFIPTKVYFDTKAKKTAEKTHDKLMRNIANSAYGLASRDWADVLADSARYIYAKQSRCSGKTLWLSSATSFADNPMRILREEYLKAIGREEDEKLRSWLRVPEFISDDLEDCEKGVPNTKLTSVTKQMHFRGKTWTHPESAYGKQGHMLVTDITSKTFLRDDDYLDVEIGDVMWYDDGNNGKAEPDDHGKLFVWQGLGVGWKKLSDDNGYFDTDTASSLQAKLMKSIENSKYGISFSDGDVVKKIKKFEEEIKMAEKIRFDMHKPTIKNVIFNDPATIVMWSDGTKTIVKCGENDVFDPEKGVAMCCMKKLLGTNKTGSNYLDKVQEYFDEYDGEQLEKCLAVRQRFMKFLAGCVKKGTDATDIPPEVTVDKEFEAVTNDDWTVVPADENTTAEENGE